MPVHVAIMMKYSDLLNHGSRSAGNYFDQLARCSGLIPINVLATINNRWTVNDPAHDSWEAEFLSDSVRNKAARFRSRMFEEGIIFTRAGALLNLKLLLGIQPAERVFQATAIGAIALHANDYIESTDTSGLASGTVPAIAEFAPAWELQNIRDPRQLLFRSSYLYALLREDERVRALFKTPLDDVPLAGLRFDQYFALLFGIYTSASSSIVAVPYPTSILDAADIAAKAGLTLEQFTRFAAAKSLTLAQAHEEFGPIVRESFAARVTSSS